MSKTIPMLPSLYANGGGIPDHDLTEEDLLWTVAGNTLDLNRDRKTRVSELRAHLFGTQYRVSSIPAGNKTLALGTYVSTFVDLVPNAAYKLTAVVRHTSAVGLIITAEVGASAQYTFSQTHAVPLSANLAAWGTAGVLEHQTILSSVFTPTIGAAWSDGTGANPEIMAQLKVTGQLQYTGQTDWYFYGAHMLFERIG